ncbi:hypothetical protein CASFOL_027765 [Castilleja foliolosa]|uniref:F-box domain-containing protein n=1 Tax=Castilleja foliolosa TaxID=1961234 RepID=A0ABD3CHF8_9LAMI
MPYRRTSESATGDAAMADCVLPLDMMLCILTRLPVKSIQRFKSVCKPLRDVLSSPEFAKMHRAQFPLNPKNQSVIICKRIIKYDQTIPMPQVHYSVEKEPIPFPQVYYFAESVEIIGCCNGLICMNFLKRKWSDQRLALWNPALNNMSTCLPVPEIEIGSPSLVSTGFGYNEETDDFKVILIVESREIKNSSVVMVYSSNSNSWSKIDMVFQFIMLEDTNNVILNGCPYWEASVDGKWVLVCFDVRKMVFKIVPGPSVIIMELGDRLFVDWKGDLGVIVCGKENLNSLDVWVFNDVGKTGWTKKCSFGSNGVNMDRLWECLKNGKIITGECLEGGNVFALDTENGGVVIDKAAGNEWWSSQFLMVVGIIQRAWHISREWKDKEWKNLLYDAL